MKKELNPFITSAYEGPDHFCDRKTETKQLIDFVENGTNVTLFAIRRLGKTGLIQHVFNQLTEEKDTICIYIDILPTQNLQDFTNQLATAIYSKFPPNKRFGKKLVEFVQQFRPIISFDELSGNPTLSLAKTTPIQQDKTIHHLFNFLDTQDLKIVFAIDEFQQILEYPEKNTEALLRTHIQQLKNTSFIFCGSNQKMMYEIFNSSKRPFFASCSNMQLDFIPIDLYTEFISNKFTERKKSISPECIDFICEWTKRHTFYTQYFCNVLFSKNLKNNDLQDAHEVAIHILKINESIFYQYRNLLSEAQWRLLKAIAKVDKLYQPNAKDFIQEYSLGTPSLVTRGMDALLAKEMIFHNSSVEKPYYEVYDKFLMRWLRQH
jgi:AAA+ ATPase superfamily predicted ATPase